MARPNRQQIAAIILRLLAVSVGLCALPFLGEGVENLMLYGPQMWSFECLGLALIPGTIAYGLWRRHRWAWKIALWVSVLAILLAPILVLFLAIATYSAGVMACVLALLLGVLFGLIVYFLTRPETKELFGIVPDSREMVRILKAAGIVVLFIALAYAVWGFRSHLVQKDADSQVVADIHEMMEQHMESLKADDPIIRHYGPFKGWQRGGWSRLSPTSRGVEWLASRLETSGTARFEKEDVEIHVTITGGSKAIAFPIMRTYTKPDDPYWSAVWRHLSATHPGFVFD